MRSIKLTTAALAAAALAASPAAAPAAHGHAGVKPIKIGGPCRVRLAVNPHLATSGDAVLLTGALVCPGGAGGEQTVTVLERVAGAGSAFKTIGTPTTAKDGSFTFTPPAVQTDSTFQATALGSHSARRTVRVAPIVTVTKAPPEGTALLTGPANKVEIAGSVSSLAANAEVVLQRESNAASEEWSPVQGGNFVQHDGSYKIVHRFGLPGDANLRVVVRPHGPFGLRGVSDVMSYVISQTQNPNLTLEAKSDPTTFGQPVTLKGVAPKVPAGQKVKISARTFGTPTFTQIAEATTGAGGAWEYTVPSALQNAFYHATAGIYHSAVVYEGVKWTIAANPVPSTVSSGTKVTFSGVATPTTRENHVVYLQRHNLFGTGWHVVDLGFTGKGGAYSIEWDVVGGGKQAYRIKVPGDAVNMGGASTPQELEVTPALAKTPTPVVQPTLPH
jgi:hypothetical protein